MDVYLESSEDIVRFSSLVQETITPLDLSTLEYSRLTPTPYTEESFQKLFGFDNRKVLFKYHLDVSHGLEQAIEERDPITREFVSHVCNSLQFFKALNRYPCVHHGIVEAIENSRDKTAKLRNFLPLMKRLPVFSEDYERRLFSFCVRILHDECTDSGLVAEFIEVCGNKSVSDFLLYKDREVEHMEYFLCHSQEMLFEGDYCCPVSRCLIRGKFKHAIILIKYGKIRRTLINDEIIKFITMDRYFHDIDINFMKFITRNDGKPGLCSDQLSCVKKGLLLLLATVYCCNRVGYERSSSWWHNPDLEIRALRLMSRSLPDTYLTDSEIRSAWKQDNDLRLDQPTASQVYTFYKTEIMDGGNQDDDVEEPRSLKHLARCEIRGRLAANFALPDGIQLLGLPQPVQGFLRLES